MEKIRPVIACTPIDDGVEFPLIVFTAQLVSVHELKRKAYHHSVLRFVDGEEWLVKERPDEVLLMMCTNEDDEEWVDAVFEAAAEEEECEDH